MLVPTHGCGGGIGDEQVLALWLYNGIALIGAGLQ